MVVKQLPLEGSDWPLGATWDGSGVNFALFSANATRVELCLFDPAGRRETDRIELPENTHQVWHGYLPWIRPGQLYGYRVYGPYAPEAGHRFNPNKLLIDPYARGLSGQLRWHDALFGYRIGHKRGDLSFDKRDSAFVMPKCVVVDPSHTWGGDVPPNRAWQDTIIYEAHVKGMTARNTALPERVRGTFEGLATRSTIDHLVDLGVTAVELLPVQAFFDDRHLVERGLTNYWGYNTIGFFAPAPRYLTRDGAINEFKLMVRRLHEAGIEVIMDVVYNHTAEGNEMGPTLSFRGIDNASYYILADEPRHYYDTTGCGNALDMRHTRTLQMVMDSLRYWVEECHVDGFRFDLATTLGREREAFDMHAVFLEATRQDPVLSRVKLIAEPWDTGPEGYQLGSFPPGWAEWNDRWRDTARAFWRGDPGVAATLADGLLGSSQLFEHEGRRPWASVNFVTAHDGFTLDDLVSYDDKHNEANGEDNNDGHDHNLSWNCGVEGPTDDPQILALRDRQRRNLMTTVVISQGLPMILMGDERGRSQHGNNNAYCQDVEFSWLDWDPDGPGDRDFEAFVRNLIAIRRSRSLLRAEKFIHADPRDRFDVRARWLRPDGAEMTPQDWDDPENRMLCLHLSGRGGGLMVFLNAAASPVQFDLPDALCGSWRLLIDTASGTATVEGEERTLGPAVEIPERSILLFEGATP
ncbi:glycogen debranching protein GlgX [Paracoccus stylophorae]|uniref:Glycogen debranching protein GlgX n=1 Tax=Paracoccus stylophorae TaxID=659350 RepID=A0ABY7SY12_9RHOB|nr:glycogen debranching protein GlgX [Paracoccus stylophorae]WCR10837.1 glycogen debranching protein GlgX [Paracoccus stylophorae]